MYGIYTQCGTERGHLPFLPWREIEKMKTYCKLRRNSTQDLFGVMVSRNQKITALSDSACRLLIRKRSKDSSTSVRHSVRVPGRTVLTAHVS
jgi:hypothetical protein